MLNSEMVWKILLILARFTYCRSSLKNRQSENLVNETNWNNIPNNPEKGRSREPDSIKQ